MSSSVLFPSYLETCVHLFDITDASFDPRSDQTSNDFQAKVSPSGYRSGTRYRNNTAMNEKRDIPT